MYFMRDIQSPSISRTLSFIVNSDISRHIHVLFRHIELYFGIFRSLSNSYIFRTLPYSKSWNIWNVRYNQNPFTTCFGIFRKLCNPRILRSHHLQNFAIFRILACLGLQTYSESCLYRHIQSYSVTIMIIKLTFFFLQSNLKTFQQNLKGCWFFDYVDVNVNARLSLPK